MPKKKGGKAALKKKQKNKAKKGQQKGKQQKQNAPNPETIVNGDSHIDDDDKNLKEFIRDIHIPSFSVAPIGGGPPLILKADLKLIHGHRYGLIGYNGAGKTTMLRKLVSGNIKEIPDYLNIHLVSQELDGTDQTVLQTVLKSHTKRENLLKEEARLRAALDKFTQQDAEAASNNYNNNNTNNDSNNTNETNTDSNKSNDTTDNNNNNDTTNTDNNADNNSSTNNNNTNNTNNNTNNNSNKKNNDNDDESKISDDLFLAYTDRLTEIAEKLKAIHSDTAEARASSVLTGLQFTDRMKNMATKDLSGGWRMRVRLACALFLEPDVLLLDEPTNHLDFPSVIWLSEYLECDYSDEKTIVIVSHDRRFLNDVCTDIIHLDRCRLYPYKGNYDSFIAIRNQMRTHQAKQYQRQQKMIKHNEEFVARFKANKKWSTQAQSRMKMLSKLNKIEKVLADLEFRFRFPDCPPLKNPNLFHLSNVDFGYFGEDSTGNTYLLKDVSLRLRKGTKVGIMGANGAGKSTLLRIIMEELKPIRGTACLSNAVEVGFFAQHHVETLDFNATPLEHLKNVFGDATVQQIYAQLGRFNLGDKLARKKIGTFSGGQKSRLAFCILTWYSPHLVVMDEPTNHLDMPTIDALAIALSDFDGSVLIVSHDQHFVETVCDEYWAVGNRSVKVFDDFQKCRDYAHKCKPIDVLPREFSTVNVKEKRYRETKSKNNNNMTDSKENDDNNGNNSNKNKNKKNNGSVLSGAFEVDVEREIDRGLDKGLKPNAIIKHLKGWKPNDNDKAVVNKLGFIVFNEYFDEKYKDIDTSDFFERWCKLLICCMPNDHIKNQMVLLGIAHACWKVAKKDKHPKAVQTYGFGMMVEIMYRQSIITQEAVEQWRKDNDSKLEGVIKKDVETFMDAANDSDSDSDSDSD